ncbi:hypothetical protein ALC57_13983, partial [Trachymyrmex cornetzi]
LSPSRSKVNSLPRANTRSRFHGPNTPPLRWPQDSPGVGRRKRRHEYEGQEGERERERERD